MHDENGDVAMSRWHCHATPDTIARTTAAVRSFALENATHAPVLTRMTDALTEALLEVFDAQTDPRGPGRTVVDAASDDACLTVRAQGPGRWPADSTCKRLSMLADRVELSFDEHRGSMSVLLEFPADVVGTDAPVRRADCTPGRLSRRVDFTVRRARRRSRHAART